MIRALICWEILIQNVATTFGTPFTYHSLIQERLIINIIGMWIFVPSRKIKCCLWSEKITITVIGLRSAWSIRCLGKLETKKKRDVKFFFVSERIHPRTCKLVFSPNIDQSVRIERTFVQMRETAVFGVTDNFIFLGADTSFHSGLGALIRASKIDFDLERKWKTTQQRHA